MRAPSDRYAAVPAPPCRPSRSRRTSSMTSRPPAAAGWSSALSGSRSSTEAFRGGPTGPHLARRDGTDDVTLPRRGPIIGDWRTAPMNEEVHRSPRRGIRGPGERCHVGTTTVTEPVVRRALWPAVIGSPPFAGSGFACGMLAEAHAIGGDPHVGSESEHGLACGACSSSRSRHRAACCCGQRARHSRGGVCGSTRPTPKGRSSCRPADTATRPPPRRRRLGARPDRP